MRLFDDYAASFDRHLVEALDYHVPEMLHRAALKARPGVGLDVIDLGCGTGLVGVLFRPVAGRLVGIDISPGMIQRAGRRGVYDQLVLDDAADYLRGRAEPCDLVLAADVFIYVGDLGPIFQEVGRLLRPGGLFAFSLETTPGADYVLQPNRRYAQSPNYVHRLAGEHGLKAVEETRVKLRRHGGADAWGLVMVLRAGAEPEAERGV
jgi:predicted TPR repeat methyltransferase